MSALVTLYGGQFTIYNLSTQLVKPNDLTYFELSARNKFALRVGKGTKDSFSRCNISNHRVTIFTGKATFYDFTAKADVNCFCAFRFQVVNPKTRSNFFNLSEQS